MAKSLNEIKLIGNLGQAPELKTFENGNKVVMFSLATTESYVKKDTNEKVETTQWHRVVAWGKLAEIIEKFVAKGDKLYVNGKMTYRQYETEAGEKKQIAVIVASHILLLSGKASATQSTPAAPSGEPFTPPPGMEEEDSDLPF